MNYKLILGVLAVLVLLFGYSQFNGGTILGKASGPAHYQHESFLQGLSAGVRDHFSVDNAGNMVKGGSSFATTTNAAGTFTAAQVCNNNLIVATPNVGAVTLTFPSTADLKAACLPNIGSEKTIRFKNATTTVGANSILTLAEGANGDHQEQEGATTLVEGTEWAEITFLNIDGTNHMMLVTVTQVAD